jgi:hypothetical protein
VVAQETVREFRISEARRRRRYVGVAILLVGAPALVCGTEAAVFGWAHLVGLIQHPHGASLGLGAMIVAIWMLAANNVRRARVLRFRNLALDNHAVWSLDPARPNVRLAFSDIDRIRYGAFKLTLMSSRSPVRIVVDPALPSEAWIAVAERLRLPGDDGPLPRSFRARIPAAWWLQRVFFTGTAFTIGVFATALIPWAGRAAMGLAVGVLLFESLARSRDLTVVHQTRVSVRKGWRIRDVALANVDSVRLVEREDNFLRHDVELRTQDGTSHRICPLGVNTYSVYRLVASLQKAGHAGSPQGT